MAPSIHPVLFFLLLFLVGSLCAYQANKRGRHPGAWFVVGILFGIFGLAILYLLPAKKLSSRYRRSTRSEAAIPPLSERLPAPSDPHQLWHYLDESTQTQGPMSSYALQDAWTKKKISPSTYVWNEKMENWKRICDLPDLFGQLKNSKKLS
ncbi:MAG: DUF4339 domain-containing protein [Chlamydiota bacterium]